MLAKYREYKAPQVMMTRGAFTIFTSLLDSNG